jgi:5'(3')-deoxyribonucleotidase
MDLECLLDVDGILANFVGVAIKAHNYTEGVYDRPEHMNEFWFNKIMGITATEFWKPLNYDFWYGLEFMPDGLEILRMVEERFGKDNVCFLTSPSDEPQCSAAKHAWIYKHFPDYKRRFLIGAGKHFATSPWRVLIDDRNENVDEFRKKGRAILLPRPWNANWRLNTIEHLREELAKL